MVSWVPQIVVPPLVALAFFRRLPRKWVVLLAPTIFLSDLDYAVPGEHRVWTHTLLWPALLFAIVVVLWRRRAPEGVSLLDFAAQPGGPLALLLIAYYLTAHAILDVFTGGVVLFWPISNLNVYLDIHVFIDTSTNQVEPQAEGGTTDGPFPLDPLYEWVSPEHAAVLAFLLACGLGWLGVRVWKAFRIARAPDSQR
jgi:hypothetical protein